MSISQTLTFAALLKNRGVERLVEQTNVYTVVRQMPIEADGRVRYRIRNHADKTERVVTEEELVELN